MGLVSRRRGVGGHLVFGEVENCQGWQVEGLSPRAGSGVGSSCLWAGWPNGRAGVVGASTSMLF